jgi:two-component system, chemotaxis family, protein-glutamate methylesterase/glutaminase
VRERIHVLVVDDSAVVRQSLLHILGREPGFTVESAPDAPMARARIARRRPDVIVLDLQLPGEDGFSFLKALMSEDPIPVVVCSWLAQRGTEAALRATEEGAVEVVAKPRFDVRGFLLDSATMLTDAIRGAAEARVRPRGLTPRRAMRPALPSSPALRVPASAPAPAARALVAIGASTGGTEAIRTILEALPADAPGIVIVQHMPEVFTRTFAERLDQICAMDVREARDGDAVRPGLALVAPGGRHLRVHGVPGRLVVEVGDGPLVSRHRPSVDVLFRSAALAAGASAVGVLLTGMGEDGAAGLLEMRRQGARTVAQDEASSVVFGMPKEAIQRGAVGEVVPLEAMSAAILRHASAVDTTARDLVKYS